MNSRLIHRLMILLMCGLVTAHAQTIEFHRDIRPILSDTCFKCHGPD